MKKYLLFVVGLFLIQTIFAQIPSGYYDSATGTGYTLKTQLYNIIKDHNSVSYSEVWTAFYKTDVKSNGKVWDMYSDVPGGTPAYEYTLGTGQCGTYSVEGDCYNREHSFPKSWFNDASPMYTDVFHLYPTDGKVNGMRSNYPFGEVGSASWTSTNGSKLGTCSYPGYTGTVFEPIDEYKGDFARTYFYMATRYQDIIGGWEKNTTYSDAVLNGTTDQVYEDWFLNMLIEWHNNDPVSQKEIDRNDSIYYNVQFNRNPFIDHPEYVVQIWGGSGVYIAEVDHSPANPTSSDVVTVTATITSSGGTITGADLKWGTTTGSYPNTVTMSATKGTYTGDISAGTDGTTIYYIIEASDDNAESATSSEYSYVIDDNPTITIFEEDFETATVDSPISINGWTRYEEAGTRTWAGTEYNSNIYAQMTAYSSGESSNISWLITPEVDLTAVTEATFTFMSKDGYNNGDPVEVFISTDYTGTGDPNTANWTNLNPILATGSSSGYASSFTESGDIDLTSYCGNTIYIAYKYSGGDPSLTTTMQIDDILITGTGSTNTAPEISGISNSPNNPDEGEDVTVSATITDSDGIASANIKWGTSAGNYPNTVVMTNAGDIYSGVIPSQVGGTHVYFVIEATDNNSGSTRSDEVDFVFNTTGNIAPTISNLDFTPTIPESNEKVAVSCIITDSDGTVNSAQIKWGTASEDYTHVVNMFHSGDEYIDSIPEQLEGTHVYFVVYAADEDGGSAQSVEQDYIVNTKPEITNILIDPTDPESTEDVRISATITDSDGNISSATLKWGTATGSYPNNITMTNESGDSYLCAIPVQNDGTEVFFIIEAEDNVGGITTSSEESYLVEDPANEAPVISEVSYEPANPTENDNVTVSCIADDTDGSIVSVLLKWKSGTASYTDVNMNLSGSKYYGQIPKQPVGTTVDFKIITEDNDGMQADYNGSYAISESSGIIEFSENSIHVFPNPANEFINIQVENYNQQLELHIYDVIGSQVYKNTVNFNNQYKLSLDGLQSGIYFISFVVDNTLITKKIVVKK